LAAEFSSFGSVSPTPTKLHSLLKSKLRMGERFDKFKSGKSPIAAILSLINWAKV
jgi:hypothetical protein